MHTIQVLIHAWRTTLFNIIMIILIRVQGWLLVCCFAYIEAKQPLSMLVTCA